MCIVHETQKSDFNTNKDHDAVAMLDQSLRWLSSLTKYQLDTDLRIK